MDELMGFGSPGEIQAVVATVDSGAEELVSALETRLAAAEERIAQLSAASELRARADVAEAVGRRTVSATTHALLAKHGVAEEQTGGLAAVDAALRSLPVEQRLAVKSELLRAGLL